MAEQNQSSSPDSNSRQRIPVLWARCGNGNYVKFDLEEYIRNLSSVRFTESQPSRTNIWKPTISEETRQYIEADAERYVDIGLNHNHDEAIQANNTYFSQMRELEEEIHEYRIKLQEENEKISLTTYDEKCEIASKRDLLGYRLNSKNTVHRIFFSRKCTLQRKIREIYTKMFKIKCQNIAYSRGRMRRIQQSDHFNTNTVRQNHIRSNKNRIKESREKTLNMRRRNLS